MTKGRFYHFRGTGGCPHIPKFDASILIRRDDHLIRVQTGRIDSNLVVTSRWHLAARKSHIQAPVIGGGKAKGPRRGKPKAVTFPVTEVVPAQPSRIRMGPAAEVVSKMCTCGFPPAPKSLLSLVIAKQFTCFVWVN